MEAFALESPRLIGRVEKGLAAVGNSVAVLVDDDGGVVVLGARRPPARDVHLLRVPDDDSAFELESDGAGP